jgi:mono/diheme cytochrome c family protein
MTTRGLFVLMLLGAVAGSTAITASADDATEAPPEFSEAFLSDPAEIGAGKEIWQEQCRHCHGRSAYPGKAPKLKPRRYTADFVFDRVTNGFRKMPPWKEVYSREQRMSVVVYILSSEFSP